MSRKIALPCLAAMTIVVFLYANSVPRTSIQSRRDRMLSELERIDRAVVETIDGIQKQRMTEAIPVTYSDTDGNAAATYFICKTTYYEADPSNVTGLDIDAIVGIINPGEADDVTPCWVNDMAAAWYKKGDRNYLCWTDTPEYSFVIEYNSEFITDEEVMRMAESVQRVGE